MKRWQTTAWVVLTFLFAASPLSADEAAIREMLGKYITAFNKHDATAVAAFWAPKCIHIDRVAQQRTEGREAILADLQKAFSEDQDIQLSGSLTSVRLVQPTVACIEGETMLSDGTDAPIKTQFDAVLIHDGQTWLLDTVDEYPQETFTSGNTVLRELEWLIGDWRDESDSAVVETSCSWSPNEAFLIRSYVVSLDSDATSQGTQIIGWDPIKATIRSWNFDSSGGFGEATWSRNGDEWLVRSRQTTSTASESVGTYVMKKIDANTMEVSLIGQEVDGVPMPNQAPVRVVRQVEASAETAKEDSQ